MDNKLTRQGASGESAHVRPDRAEEQIRLLDEATERFNRRLEEVGHKSTDQGGEDPDDLMKATTRAISEMNRSCNEFEKGVGYNRTVIKKAQIEFREKTARFFSQAYFKRARTWPQGYQGDYEMLEILYDNKPTPDGIGHFIDRYFLSCALAVAVRGRKETLRNLLQSELSNRQAPKILDIACGSCRDLLDLAAEIKSSAAQIICIDLDSDALNFSAKRMADAGLLSHQVQFRQYNALKMVNAERSRKEFGLQDVIFSVGLFDYLKDDVLVRLLGSLYNLLTPGGKLITSFKDRRRYDTADYHWHLDWDGFFQRTEEDVVHLLQKAGIPVTSLSTSREESGVIIFFVAEK